jgi:hypothetical protein
VINILGKNTASFKNNLKMSHKSLFIMMFKLYKLVWCLFISAEQFKLDGMTKVFRNRIMDIRWFMRVLNEAIARKTNFEDNCTRRLFGIR